MINDLIIDWIITLAQHANDLKERLKMILDWKQIDMSNELPRRQQHFCLPQKWKEAIKKITIISQTAQDFLVQLPCTSTFDICNYPVKTTHGTDTAVHIYNQDFTQTQMTLLRQVPIVEIIYQDYKNYIKSDDYNHRNIGCIINKLYILISVKIFKCTTMTFWSAHVIHCHPKS